MIDEQLIELCLRGTAAAAMHGVSGMIGVPLTEYARIKQADGRESTGKYGSC